MSMFNGNISGCIWFFHRQETLCRVGADGKYNLYVLEPAAARIEPVVNRDEQVGLWDMVSEPGSSIYIYYYIYIIYITYIFVYIIYTCDRYVIEIINDNNSNSDLNNNGNNNIDTL
jgi:hypothetical protein